MALRVDNIRLHEFRGYSEFSLGDLSSFVIIKGPNAVGKTNLVEALRLLTAGESFRARKWGELVSWGCDACEVEARFRDEPRVVEHAVVVRGEKHSFLVNGKKKRSAAFSQSTSSVLFTPDDLQLVKASSACRRDEVDSIGKQLSQPYGKLLKDYKKCLKQRNALLKEERVPADVMRSWDESLIAAGAHLCAKRQSLFFRIARKTEEVYREISQGEEMAARYIPAWERFDSAGCQLGDPVSLQDGGDVRDAAQIADKLADLAHRVNASERQRHTTLFGPHKDEIAFFIDGKDARLFASQGQQRSIVLAEKIAALAVMEEISGNKPFLLLDDVMSELDELRRNCLASFFNTCAQTFVTTTNLGYFSDEVLGNARIVELPVEGTRHIY